MTSYNNFVHTPSGRRQQAISQSNISNNNNYCPPLPLHSRRVLIQQTPLLHSNGTAIPTPYPTQPAYTHSQTQCHPAGFEYSGTAVDIQPPVNQSSHGGSEMAMGMAHYAPAGYSNAAPQFNPQGVPFQSSTRSSYPHTVSPQMSGSSLTTPHAGVYGGVPARHRSSLAHNPPNSAPPGLSGPFLAAPLPTTVGLVPNIAQIPTNGPSYPPPPAEMAHVYQPLASTASPCLIQGRGPAPFASPAIAYDHHVSTRHGNRPVMYSAVPSTAENRQSFDTSVQDGNLERLFDGIFEYQPRQPTEPRIAHEAAEAMSIWGQGPQTSQEEFGVNGQRPPVRDSIAHVGEHLPLNQGSLPTTQPAPPLRFVQHDGITQPVAGRTGNRKGPANTAAYKKTRAAGACISCQVRRGSKNGNCTVHDQTREPCPPCVKYYRENAKKYCIRITQDRLGEFLPFEKDIADAALPPSPDLPQPERNAGEDVTVYFTLDASSLTASPTMIFKLDGSPTLPREPIYSSLEEFIKDSFSNGKNLWRATTPGSEEAESLHGLEMCACYLSAISQYAETVYRIDLHPNDIVLAQQISHRVIQIYLKEYSSTFRSLFERSLKWMKAPKKSGTQRDVAAQTMCGLSRLVEYQSKISIPSSMSSIFDKLVAPAGERLQEFRNLAELATEMMNDKPPLGFEEFATTVLLGLSTTLRSHSAPGITIAHAFVPRADSRTQTPPAIVGLRGNTNPFHKSGSLLAANLHGHSGDMDMVSLQRLKAGASVTASVMKNSPTPPIVPTVQSDEPPPEDWSTATEPDFTLNYDYDPSSPSSLPFDLPVYDSNEAPASMEEFLATSTTPPLNLCTGDIYDGTATSQLPYHSDNVLYSFDRDCSTPGEESGWEEKGLREASMTSGTDELLETMASSSY